MREKQKPKRHRSWTLGSWLMALVTLAGLIALWMVLPKLTQRADISSALVGTVEDWASQTAKPESTRRPAAAAAVPTPAPTPRVTEPTAVPRSGTVTLTFGGTVAVETNVRQSGYYRDTGKYDFSEILAPAAGAFQGDLSLVSLENLVVPDAKMTKLVAPEAVMPMLRRAGIRQIALGFGRCFEQGQAGAAATIAAAQDAGLTPVGLYADAESAAPEAQILKVGGLKVALLHGTANLTSASSKALKKSGNPDLVTGTSALAERIRAVKAAGAQFVAVSVHWGAEGRTSPTKAQKTLAQQLAAAGADLIIGNGARRVQPAEWLFTQSADGTQRQTLCCYCLGCLLSDSREAGAVASAVVRVQVSYDASGLVAMGQPTYTPMYLWLYKQDSANNYRLLRADQPAPDGMESSQAKALQNALKNVRKALDGGALVQGQ